MLINWKKDIFHYKCVRYTPSKNSAKLINRAVTVADFYHRGGNGPTTAGGAVLIYIYIYIYLFIY